MLRLTERDCSLIKDLNRVKVLTIRQIKELYFKDKPKYAHRRLGMLKEAGYVQTKPLMETKYKGRKITTCFYVTDKAVRELGLEASMQMSRIMEGHLQNLRVKVNDIFVMIQRSNWPWIWLDSREIKKQKGLNRSAEINGAIKLVDNFSNDITYAVYCLPEKISDKKIYEIKYEINRHSISGFNHVIVFCETKDVFDRFGNEELNTTSLLKLPFKFGLDLLSFLGPKNENISIITNYMLRSEPFKSSVSPYTNQEIYYEGQRYQFVEFLTNDLARINFVKTYGKQFTENGKNGILALVFDSLYQDYEKFFKELNFIRLIKVPHNLIYKLKRCE